MKGETRVWGGERGWAGKSLKSDRSVSTAKILRRGASQSCFALVIQFPKQHHRSEYSLESQNNDDVSHERNGFPHGYFGARGIPRGYSYHLTRARVDAGAGGHWFP